MHKDRICLIIILIIIIAFFTGCIQSNDSSPQDNSERSNKETILTTAKGKTFKMTNIKVNLINGNSVPSDFVFKFGNDYVIINSLGASKDNWDYKNKVILNEERSEKSLTVRAKLIEKDGTFVWIIDDDGKMTYYLEGTPGLKGNWSIIT